MSAAFSIPKESVRIISPHTGGGFGARAIAGFEI
jgi:CO/xanthine dehydrogenase Mo-binding subunit